jgi:hypothetical protein
VSSDQVEKIVRLVVRNDQCREFNFMNMEEKIKELIKNIAREDKGYYSDEGCYIDFDKEDIEYTLVDSDIEELSDELIKLFSLDPVSKSLSDLKKLLAEMTIKLITTEQECKEKHQLIRDIETAKESINALR